MVQDSFKGHLAGFYTYPVAIRKAPRPIMGEGAFVLHSHTFVRLLLIPYLPIHRY